MSAPPSGSWVYTYDADVDPLPTSADDVLAVGGIFVAPDPLGTDMGSFLRIGSFNYWFLHNTPTTTDVRSLAFDLVGLDQTSPGADLVGLVSEGTKAGTLYVTDGMVRYATNDALTTFADVASINGDLHRLYVVMHGATCEIIIDGVSYAGLPTLNAAALGVQYSGQLLVAVQGDFSMVAFSEVAETYDGPTAFVLPTSISLGGDGIAFDLDEFALYGAPLTATQIHILDAAGRGVPR